MRLVDVLLALPFLLFVTAVGVAVGRADVGTVLLVLGARRLDRRRAPRRAPRPSRSAPLDFVAAARALGAGPSRDRRRATSCRTSRASLVVVATHQRRADDPRRGGARLPDGGHPAAARHVGAHAPRGRALPRHAASRSLAIPGFAILLAVLGWNRVGDGLRDALAGDGRDGDLRGRASARRSALPVDLLLAGAALLLLSFARPTRSRPRSAPPPTARCPRRGGVLHGATFVNVRTLDPALAFDEASQPAHRARLRPPRDLGRPGPASSRTSPRSFAASPDGRTYTFELREGARFHDGAPVLARDVKRSLERLLHPRTPSPAASMYATIRGLRRLPRRPRRAPRRASASSATASSPSTSTRPTRPSSPR